MPPLVSVPKAAGIIPAATEAALPPLEPPDVLSKSYGLRGVPWSAFFEAVPSPNSDILVFPALITPYFLI